MNESIKKDLRGYIERETTSFYNEIGRYIVVKDVFLLELEEYIDELEKKLHNQIELNYRLKAKIK